MNIETGGKPTLLLRLHRLALLVEDTLLVAILTSLVLLATSQILLRNIWGIGIAWSDPLLRVLVLWIALLGAMAATRDNNHIRIDILSHYLPERLRQLSRRITDLFATVVSCLLAWHSARFVYLEWEVGNILFGSIPAWLCELIIPLGFGVMALRFLLASVSRQVINAD